jgi:oleate hydratase
MALIFFRTTNEAHQMQNKRLKTLDRSKSHLWIVGGGIAGMAAAAFAIRDAKVPAEHIHILEELNVSGGSMDGGHNPLNPNQAWVTRGGRMLTDETYLCTWDLFSSIPSLENPDISVREECREFNEQVKTNAQARLIDSNHIIAEAQKLGLSTLNRAQMLRLLALKEDRIGSRRIDEFFDDAFFQSNFWRMWRTTLPFKNGIAQQNYAVIFYVSFKNYHASIP